MDSEACPRGVLKCFFLLCLFIIRLKNAFLCLGSIIFQVPWLPLPLSLSLSADFRRRRFPPPPISSATGFLRRRSRCPCRPQPRLPQPLLKSASPASREKTASANSMRWWSRRRTCWTRRWKATQITFSLKAWNSALKLSRRMQTRKRPSPFKRWRSSSIKDLYRRRSFFTPPPS